MKNQQATKRATTPPPATKKSRVKAQFNVRDPFAHGRQDARLTTHPLDTHLSDSDWDAHRLDELEMATFMTSLLAN